MTKRTTGQWEALLYGTTPGPWREDSDGEILGRRTGEVESWELDPVVGNMHRDSDNTLASFAPAAVAEVVRLRREIIAMRDRHLARIAAADYITADILDAQSTADDLTRILEGEE